MSNGVLGSSANSLLPVEPVMGFSHGFLRPAAQSVLPAEKPGVQKQYRDLKPATPEAGFLCILLFFPV